MKICIACSAGGHLTEIMQLRDAFEKYEHFFVTYKSIDSKKLKNAYFVKDPRRSPIRLLKNIFQALDIIISEKPDVIITTGAGVAVPLCWIGKFFGSKVVYLESFCRIDKKSLTGKLLYPISDLFLIQWKELLKDYGENATYKGRVF